MSACESKREKKREREKQREKPSTLCVVRERDKEIQCKGTCARAPMGERASGSEHVLEGGRERERARERKREREREKENDRKRKR